MHSAHINVNGVEQQRGAVWVCVEPALKGDLIEMFRLACAWFYLRLGQVVDVRLLAVMRSPSHSWNVQTMGGFHIRRVVEATNEGVDSNIDGALDVAIASQREVRQPTLFARGHAKLHRCRR